MSVASLYFSKMFLCIFTPPSLSLKSCFHPWAIFHQPALAIPLSLFGQNSWLLHAIPLVHTDDTWWYHYSSNRPTWLSTAMLTMMTSVYVICFVIVEGYKSKNVQWHRNSKCALDLAGQKHTYGCLLYVDKWAVNGMVRCISWSNKYGDYLTAK